MQLGEPDNGTQGCKQTYCDQQSNSHLIEVFIAQPIYLIAMMRKGNKINGFAEDELPLLGRENRSSPVNQSDP